MKINGQEFDCVEDQLAQLKKIVCIPGLQDRHSVGVDSDGLKISTSYTNFPQMYVVNRGGSQEVFTDPNELLKCVNLNVDKEGFLSNLFFHGHPTGRTMIDNVRLIPPRCQWTPGGRFSFKFVAIEDLASVTSAKSNRGSDSWIEDQCSQFISSATDLILGVKKTGKRCWLGVSGGFDSRLALSLAERAELEVLPFYIGRPKGRLRIRTGDYSSAIGVVSHFGAGALEICDPNRSSYINRFHSDVLMNPLSGAELGRLAEPAGLAVENDVLLNGGWGFWVQKPQLEDVRDNDILSMKSLFHKRNRWRKLNVGVARLAGRSFDSKATLDVEMPVIHQQLLSILRKFHEVVDGAPAENILDLWNILVLSAKISGGMFESLGGRIPPVSIYANTLPRLPVGWSRVPHANRKFLNTVLKRLDPQLLGIAGQAGKGGTSFASRAGSLARTAVAGHGVMNYSEGLRDSFTADILVSEQLNSVTNAVGLDLKVLHDLSLNGVCDPHLFYSAAKMAAVMSGSPTLSSQSSANYR